MNHVMLLTVVCRTTAQLKGANFKKAIMKGIDLRGADCRSANFEGTDLTNAILVDADILFHSCVSQD